MNTNSEVRFRLLNAGDLVLPSDEFIDDDCINWLPAERWTVGRPWHNGLKPMRRAIGDCTPAESPIGMQGHPRPKDATYRQHFEQWILTQPYFGYDLGDTSVLDRDADGYQDACVHAAWMGYQLRTQTTGQG